MPALLKKRFYDVGGTQVQVDVRGIWDSDTAARAAGIPGNPMVKLGAFKGPYSQEEFKPCFILLVAILEGLFKVDGRSVLSVICSHGRNRSATLVVALSALFEVPMWLPSYGDAAPSQEWWCIASLPNEILQQLEDWRSEARGGPFRHGRAVPAPHTPPGPPPGGPYHGHGTFDPADLTGAMPSVGNPLVDAVRLDIWKVAPGVLLELDELRLDEKCIRAVANIAGHSDDGAKFVREIFQVLQRNSADLRTYSNPSAAITSAVRKELDRLRPEIQGLPGSSGRSDFIS
ncbi:mao [Symbiodinium sp. CCMP2592]|nr:mao [Symbiodinium sp. CCMP2592]